jgi:hypothetical protein
VKIGEKVKIVAVLLPSEALSSGEEVKMGEDG